MIIKREFPDEIVEHIFSFLSIFQKRLFSKKYNAQYNCIYENRGIKNYEECYFINDMTELSNMDFFPKNTTTAITDTFHEHCANLPKKKEIFYSHWHIWTSYRKIMLEMSRARTQLQEKRQWFKLLINQRNKMFLYDDGGEYGDDNGDDNGDDLIYHSIRRNSSIEVLFDMESMIHCLRNQIHFLNTRRQKLRRFSSKNYKNKIIWYLQRF